jgi:hypothetical protein
VLFPRAPGIKAREEKEADCDRAGEWPERAREYAKENFFSRAGALEMARLPLQYVLTSRRNTAALAESKHLDRHASTPAQIDITAWKWTRAEERPRRREASCHVSVRKSADEDTVIITIHDTQPNIIM